MVLQITKAAGRLLSHRLFIYRQHGPLGAQAYIRHVFAHASQLDGRVTEERKLFTSERLHVQHIFAFLFAVDINCIDRQLQFIYELAFEPVAK